MCTNPLRAFKIYDDCKFIVKYDYHISDSSINRISFSGIWYNDYDKKVKIPCDYYEEIKIPCRKCMECRLKYAREWALKGMCEFRYFNQVGCFITLTYDNEHLPSYDLEDCSKDFQDFMKRLRKKFSGRYPAPDLETGEIKYPIRYLHCGEYGTLNGRPHHHAILFNFDFPDKKLKAYRNGYPVFYSKELLKLWSERVWTGEYETIEKVYNGKVKKYKRKLFKYIPKGKVEIGSVTFKSISYVARYITKKVYGEDASVHYGTYKPEYITMSRRPGIGRYWFDKYHWDMYTYDTYLTSDGYHTKPPKSFDKYFEALYPDTFAEIKAYRKEMALSLNKPIEEEYRENKAREYIQEVSAKKLIRPLNGQEFYSVDERKMLQNDSCFRI